LERAIVASVYDVPFYVAAPFSTFDPFCTQGSEITIEYRDEAEVLYAEGINAQGRRDTLLIANPGSKALNPAFDITPAHLIKAFITDRGIIKPEPAAIKKMLGNNLCNIRA
ncbi:MAG: hypothetical protein JXB60_04080, partial [Candidatus Cloacimonetes bacterium]|nr:hypothetical protein [Candidatus Cloacimonadota bacterium]